MLAHGFSFLPVLISIIDNRQIIDDLGNGTVGYNFIVASPQLLQLQDLFAAHIQANFLQMAADNDNFMKQFIRDVDALERLFIVAVYFSSGRPPRQSETGTHFLVNTQSHSRGVFFQHSQIFLSTNHEKMKGRTWNLSDATRWLSSESTLQVALPLYALFRPLCVSFAAALSKPDDSYAFFLYAFVIDGHQYRDTDFSAALKRVLLDHFGIHGWGTKDCRQLIANLFDRFHTAGGHDAVELAQFPKPKRKQINQEKTQSGNSEATLEIVYGHDDRSLPSRGMTRLHAERAQSDMHHKFLRLDSAMAHLREREVGDSSHSSQLPYSKRVRVTPLQHRSLLISSKSQVNSDGTDIQSALPGGLYASAIGLLSAYSMQINNIQIVSLLFEYQCYSILCLSPDPSMPTLTLSPRYSPLPLPPHSLSPSLSPSPLPTSSITPLPHPLSLFFSPPLTLPTLHSHP